MGNTNSTEEHEGNSQRRRPQSQNSDGLEILGAVLGGVAVAGAAYMAYRSAQRDDSTKSARASITPRTENYNHPKASIRTSQIPIIAVDATPTCGGGLLVIHRKKEVCFYSLDWSSVLSFGYAPDVFEMTNAFIAMTLWESDLHNEENVSMKVDNTVFNRLKYKERNTYWNRIDSLRREIGGTWSCVTSDSDKEHKIADKLSRGKAVNWRQEYPNSDGWTIFCGDAKAGRILKSLIHSGKIPNEYVR